jgi:hypothetical protein
MGNMRGFWSYARLDDQNGKVSRLRKAFEQSLSEAHGEDVELYQDTNHTNWGEDWKKRIEKELKNADFLIAVVSPSYLKRTHCRYEFEQAVKLGKTILPLYYRKSPLLEEKTTRARAKKSDDRSKAQAAQFAEELGKYQHRDFRDHRNKSAGDGAAQNFIDNTADHLVQVLDS